MSLIRREQLNKLNLLEEGLEQLEEGQDFEAGSPNPAALEVERLLDVAKIAREFPAQGLSERSRAALLASLSVKMQTGVTNQQVEVENNKSEPTNLSSGVAKSAWGVKLLFAWVVAPLCIGLVLVAIGLALLSYSSEPPLRQPTVPTNLPVFTPSPTLLAPTQTALPTTTPAVTTVATTTAPINTEAGVSPSPALSQTNPRVSTAVPTTGQSTTQPPPTLPSPKPTEQARSTSAAPDPATTPPALPTQRPDSSNNTVTVGVTTQPITVLETPTLPVTTSRPSTTTANPTPSPTTPLPTTPAVTPTPRPTSPPTTPAVTTTPPPTSPPTTTPPVNPTTLTPGVKSWRGGGCEVQKSALARMG